MKEHAPPRDEHTPSEPTGAGLTREPGEPGRAPANVRPLADLYVLPVFGRCGAAEVTQQPGQGASSPCPPSAAAREPDFVHLLEQLAAFQAEDEEELLGMRDLVFALRRENAALKAALARRQA